MKQFFTKTGWLIAIILVVSALSMLFTGIIQMCMKSIGNMNGTEIPEDILLGASGSIGVALAAITLWLAMRRSAKWGFYHCERPAGMAWRAVFILFIFATCRVVLPAIWAYIPFTTGDSGTLSTEPLWVKIALGVVLAPVFEELLFRKDILSLLLHKFTWQWSVGLSAFLFAIIHGYNAEGFVSCLFAGALFAILMLRTGSLMTCIAAHGLCNLEALVYNMLEDSGCGIIVMVAGHSVYNVAINVIGLIVMVACAIYLWRNDCGVASCH